MEEKTNGQARPLHSRAIGNEVIFVPEWSEHSAEEFFVGKLPEIGRIVTTLGRRKAMSDHDLEDFRSMVMLRLIENDYDVIRRYNSSTASFATYIAVVVHHQLIDYQHHRWGKWHASAEAKSHGLTGVRLEQLLVRDGRSVEEAFAVLRSEFPYVSREKVEEIAARLPRRMRRRIVDLDSIDEPSHVPAISLVTEEIAARMSSVVREFLDELPAEEQLIFQLRFEADMTVAQIARSLHLDSSVLYRRLHRHFGLLRSKLEAAGVGRDDVGTLIGTNTPLLDFKLGTAKSARWSRAEDEEWVPEVNES